MRVPVEIEVVSPAVPTTPTCPPRYYCEHQHPSGPNSALPDERDHLHGKNSLAIHASDSDQAALSWIVSNGGGLRLEVHGEPDAGGGRRVRFASTEIGLRCAQCGSPVRVLAPPA